MREREGGREGGRSVSNIELLCKKREDGACCRSTSVLTIQGDNRLHLQDIQGDNTECLRERDKESERGGGREREREAGRQEGRERERGKGGREKQERGGREGGREREREIEREEGGRKERKEGRREAGRDRGKKRGGAWREGEREGGRKRKQI